MLKSAASKFLISASMVSLLFACSTKESEKKKLKSAPAEQAEINRINNSARDFTEFEEKINSQGFKTFIAKSDTKIPVAKQKEIVKKLIGENEAEDIFDNSKQTDSLPQLNKLLVDYSKTCDKVGKFDQEAFAFSCKIEDNRFRLSGAANEDMIAWYAKFDAKNEDQELSLDITFIMDLKKESIQTILNADLKAFDHAANGYVKVTVSLDPQFKADIDAKANLIGKNGESGKASATGTLDEKKISMILTVTSEKGETKPEKIEIIF